MEKHKKEILIILLLTLILSLPFYTKNFYYGHDSNFHFANTYDLIMRIKTYGLNFTKISIRVGNGYGYGVNLFYPQLTHIISTIFGLIISIFNKNVVISSYIGIKIEQIFCMFLSGIIMYGLTQKIFNNKKISLTSSIIYMTFPYHLNDIYIRGAYAETWMFICIPLVILGLYELTEQNYLKFYIFFILGYYIGINSHMITMLYFTFFLLTFFIVYRKQIFNKKSILSLFLSSVIILGISSPYLLPLIKYKSLGIYKTFLPNIMTTQEKFIKSSIGLKDYIIPWFNNDYGHIIIFINPLIILIFLYVLINYKKLKLNKKQQQFTKFLLIILLIVTIFISPLLSWLWKLLPYSFYIIQFLWRMEIIHCICMSIISALVIKLIYDNKIKFKKLMILPFLITLFLPLIYSILVLIGNEVDFNKTDIELHGLGVQQEYLPKNCVFETLMYRIKNIVIINGNAKIETLKDNVPYIKYKVTELNTKNITIELPRIYYPGYELTNTKTKRKYNVTISAAGLIKANIDSNGIYELNYVGTKYDKISKILFICALTLYIIIIVIYKRRSKNEKIINSNTMLQ